MIVGFFMRRHHFDIDFTSLLDIFMVILFFFIIFGKIETQNAEESISEREHAVSEAAQNNEKEKEKYQGLLEDVKKRLKEANEAKERSGDNVDALNRLNSNKSMKLYLNMIDDSDWNLKVYYDGNETSSINKLGYKAVANQLKIAFSQIKLATEDTVIIEIIYDFNKAGTNSASKVIDDSISELRKEYSHLFVSVIDIGKLDEKGE